MRDLLLDIILSSSMELMKLEIGDFGKFVYWVDSWAEL